MSTPSPFLKVTLIQSDLYWEDIGANLSMFEEKIWQIGEKTDVIVLPEMFNTGFSMNVQKTSEPMNLTTFKWMKQQASQTNALVVGSLAINEGGKYYNRLIGMQPDGEYFQYDKRHLFQLMGEGDTFEMGNEIKIHSWKGWKICPMICYDLRFPVWSRNVGMNYDLLIYIANWPVPRVNAWDTLLKARAIENLAYCIGVNRVGEDGNAVPFSGHSAAIDPKGKELAYLEEEEDIQTISLDYEKMKAFREKFPVYLDADKFEVEG